MTVNNVVRFLNARKVAYKLLESEPVRRSAVETAALCQLDPDIVFKTIVMKRTAPGKPILCIVPGSFRADEKKVAAILKEKKVSVVSQNEAEKLTKAQAGGISPLALIHHGFTMLLHESALRFPEITVSGGQRGLTVLIAPADLIALISPIVADIASQTDIHAEN